jgi:hypothetical protein
MPYYPFAGAAYSPESRAVDRQTCVNLYPEVRETATGPEDGLHLVHTPGLLRLATIPDNGPLRGIYATRGLERCFVAASGGLYELKSDFSLEMRGTWPIATAPVSMADNGVELLVVDGEQGYVLTLSTNTWRSVESTAFPGAEFVGFVDGYFVLARPNTGQWFVSGLYNGRVYDALEFATAEGAPDILLSLLVSHREVWLFGRDTTEIWFDAGNVGFPFARIDGAFLEQGILAAHSAVAMGTSIYWLGRNQYGAGIVYRAVGYQPQRISTHAIEYQLRQQAQLETATAYSYQAGGHDFYVLNCAAATWVYDITTGLWHERRSFLAPGNTVQSRHRVAACAWVFGRHCVIDYVFPYVYALDDHTYLDDTEAIVRERTGPEITEEQQWIMHQRLELASEKGTGADGAPLVGQVPAWLLDWTDDAGGTWSVPQYGTPGAIGALGTRSLWRRLGRSRERRYRLRTSDPVRTILTSAVLHVELGGR